MKANWFETPELEEQYRSRSMKRQVTGQEKMFRKQYRLIRNLHAKASLVAQW